MQLKIKYMGGRINNKCELLFQKIHFFFFLGGRQIFLLFANRSIIAQTPRIHEAVSDDPSSIPDSKSSETSKEIKFKPKKYSKAQHHQNHQQFSKKEDKPQYRDRAKERREGIFVPEPESDDIFDFSSANRKKDSAGIGAGSANELNLITQTAIGPQLPSSFTEEESKFLGGDIERTHLVKGLDYALLAKTRTEIEQNKEAKPESSDEKANPTTLLTAEKNKIFQGAKILNIEPHKKFEQNSAAAPASDQSNFAGISPGTEVGSALLKFLKRQEYNQFQRVYKNIVESFLPRRMSFVYTVTANTQSQNDNSAFQAITKRKPSHLNDLPITITRSKQECPAFTVKPACLF